MCLLLSATMLLQAQHREERNVDRFTKISFGLPGKLYLKQGSPQKVVLEGDQDVLGDVETDVSGGRLRIAKKGRWSNWNSGDHKIVVYVTVADIEAVGVSGSGSVIGQSKIKAGDLDLNVSGSGSLSLEANVSGDVEVDVSGSGDLTFEGTCQSFESDVSGSGNINLSANVDDAAEFGISGSGKIKARGSADRVKADISGAGKVLAADLQADRCEVRISGSGDVEINVKSELDADISGSGSVSYTGNPNKVNSNSSGSGKVRKM